MINVTICKASSGWVIQGGSRSQKGKQGCKRGGGEERESVCVCVCVEMESASMVVNETKRDDKKRCKVPRNRRARYGSRGSVECRRQAGEYGGASGRLPERLMALVARFTLRVKGGNTRGGGRGKSSPLTCLPFDEAVRTALALALQLRSVPCCPTLTDARPTSPTPQARALDLALLVSSDRRVSIPVPRPGHRALARSGTLVG